MAELLVIGVTVLALYLALGTVLAVISRRFLGAGEADFYIAAGRLGGFLSAMTYAATTYSAFMMVGLVGFAYSTGVGALGFELVYLVATLLLLAYFAPTVWERARSRGWISPGEMLSDHYGSRHVGLLVSLVFLVALIPYASAQLKGIGETVAGLAGGGDVFYLVGVAMGLAVMLLWSLIAGVWSVAITDALQGLWMITAGTGLLVWLLLRINETIGFWGATNVLAENGLLGVTPFWRPSVFLAFTIPWMFFAVTNPQVVQRLYMPRDKASVASMIRWFGVFGLYFTVLVTLIGLLARAAAESGVVRYVDPGRRDAVTPTLLFQADPVLASIVFTSIVAAAVSTTDSILLTLASSASRDLGYKVRGGARRRLGYIAVLLVAAGIVVISVARVGYIVQLSVLSSLILLPLAPITLAAWAGVRSSPAAPTLSVLTGVAVISLATIYYGGPLNAFLATPLGAPLALWVLALSTLSFVITHLGVGRQPRLT